MKDGYWDKYWNRRVSRRRVLAGGATVAAGSAALLAGCGGDDDDGSEDPTAAADPTAASNGGDDTPDPTQVSPTEDTSAARYGGTFHDANTLGGPPTGFDPAITITYGFGMAQTFHQLMAYSLIENEFYADGATSWEQVDDTTLVLNLRGDATFNPDAGDRPVTSEDWAYSIGRYPNARQNLGSNVNEIFFSWMGPDRGAVLDTPDDLTLQINQAFPFASNLFTLAAASIVAVPKEIVEGNGGDLGNLPIGGAGPYMFDQVTDTSISLKRNPNYHTHTDPLGRHNPDMPYIDRWEDQIIADSAAREARFLAGDSDRVGVVDKIKAAEWEGQPNVQILEGPANNHLMMQLDAHKWAPYPELSKAISLAIDWDLYIDIILGGEGQRGAPVGPAFTNFVLSQDEIRELQQYDPEQAKTLWDNNNGNDIFPELSTTISAWAPAPGPEFVAQSISQTLDINVNLNPLDVGAYIASANGHIGLKDWDFFIASNNAISTMPDWNALVGYAPDGFGAIWGGNWYKGSLISEPYENPDHQNYIGDTPDGQKVLGALEITDPYARELQDLVIEQQSVTDPEERAELLKALQRRIFTRFCCTLPLPTASVDYFPVGKRVKNMPPPPDGAQTAAFGLFRAHNVWLENA